MGGAEKLLLDLSRISGNRSIKYYHGYLSQKHNFVADMMIQDGENVRCFNAHSKIRTILSLLSITRFVKDKKIDIIHSHLPISGVVSRIVGWWLDLPVVYTEHNLPSSYNAVTRTLNKMTWSLNSVVIAVSDKVKSDINKSIGGNVKVCVIKNGIDTEKFKYDENERSRVRNDLGIPVNAHVIGVVAKFRAEKCLSEWLEIAGQIHARFPDTHFIIVGEGPESKKLKNLAYKLGVMSNTHFVGMHSNTIPYYSAMDIFMLTSKNEGLPLALLEAMSMQLVIVFYSSWWNTRSHKERFQWYIT